VEVENDKDVSSAVERILLTMSPVAVAPDVVEGAKEEDAGGEVKSDGEDNTPAGQTEAEAGTEKEKEKETEVQGSFSKDEEGPSPPSWLEC
jgi:hypothetical protein